MYVLAFVILLGLSVCSGVVLAQAQSTTIWSFQAGNSDGELPFPYGHLPFDGNGALYGTTAAGGAGDNGTVYRLVPPSVQGGAWGENLLYVFAGGADGRQQSNGILFDQNGNPVRQYQLLRQPSGVRRPLLSPPAEPGGEWTHTVLWTFQGSFDGQYPGEVVFGPNGGLYGTTTSGELQASPAVRIEESSSVVAPYSK